ncbi:hypothetical protein RHGRI_010265 [Rhododendron griersonianum]|uniref:Uncharacterized protein n=1 Tax=Rhododendron griersonianum TaxID=479676 RepID=A0AAV6KHU5_9ERIC|nr:hypothetical protein RHGRI_010265 [Rhododendron griersonianum]
MNTVCTDLISFEATHTPKTQEYNRRERLIIQPLHDLHRFLLFLVFVVKDLDQWSHRVHRRDLIVFREEPDRTGFQLFKRIDHNALRFSHPLGDTHELGPKFLVQKRSRQHLNRDWVHKTREFQLSIRVLQLGKIDVFPGAKVLHMEHDA